MVTGFSFDFSEFRQLSRDLGKIAATVKGNERKAVMLAGEAFKADVVPLAPIDKGQYRAGIRVDPGEDFFGPVALIGSPAPQARRLEFGFVGPDSLGRVYHQKPRPHWRPAWDNNLRRYRSIMLEALAGGRT